jgi:conjugal transfer mating pair stabilization protein TraN
MKKILVYLTLFFFVTHATLGIAGPGDEGREAGAAGNAAIRGMVNQPSAQAVVPDYTTTPPAAPLFGSTNLNALGTLRLSACATLLVNDPTCEAQRGATASANTPRPSVSPYDASVVTTRDIQRNPGTTLDDMSPSYDGSQFCIGANCFNTAYTSDADFARSVTFMEAAREAGVYIDTDHMQMFKGEDDRCRDRLIKNCCDTNGAGAGMSNQSMFGTGSRFVYDVLMNADNREFVYRGFQALLMGSGFSGTFTTYGVTVAVNGAALPASSVALYSGDTFVVAFDPWSLVIAIVIYIVISMMSCDQNEGMLAMKKGASLCLEIGSWCSSCIRIFGKCISCTEHTHSHCCFNSRLARMINEQGRAQIGKGWGDAQNPDCSGFTVAQLQSLNFAAMDLSEFYASIVPTLPDVSAIQGNAASRVGNCYYGRGRC